MKRFGKSELVEAIQAAASLKEFELSKQDCRTLLNLVLDCMANGLFEHGNLVLDKLGSFNIQPRSEEIIEHSSDLAIKTRVAYKQTKHIRDMLKYGNTL